MQTSKLPKIQVDHRLPPAQFNVALLAAVRAKRAEIRHQQAAARNFERSLELFAKHGWTGTHAVEMAQAHQRIGGTL